MKVQITNHAMEQMKKRTHMSSEEIIKMVQRAWTNGMRVTEYHGGCRESFENAKNRHYGQESVYRIYKGMRYVFTYDGILITAYSDSRIPTKAKSYRNRRYHIEAEEYEMYSNRGIA